MKAKIITSIALAIIAVPNLARAACMDIEECLNTAPAGYCCCTNGQTGSSYSCPDGYTLSGTTCSRADTTSSDETGTYVISYDTCNATVSLITCTTTVLQSSIRYDQDCMCMDAG